MDQKCRARIFVRPGGKAVGSVFALQVVAALALTMSLSAAAQTVPKLNDTGIVQCYDNTAVATCATVATDVGTHPRQDGRYGRDAKNAAATLTKTGAGNKGFDYTKVCNSGELAGAGACPATPALGTGPNDWACTKDNVTGLIWEIKTATSTDLRFSGHTYTWYSIDSATNGGVPGDTGNNTCNATLPSNLCNTEAYVAAVNGGTVCGRSNWRLPNVLELQSLIDFSTVGVSSPTVDTTYFPNTVANGFYWSGTTRSFSIGLAYTVGTAATAVVPKNKVANPVVDIQSARLVSSGP